MLTNYAPWVPAGMQLPDRVAFTVGGFAVYWYGILLAVSILAAIFLVDREARRKGFSGDTAVDLCLVAIPFGVVGARLWYVVTFSDFFQADFLSVFRIWDGGLSVYGAALFILLGVMLYVWKKKIPPLKLLDAVAPALLAAQLIGLWGDFFNQTGYGPEITAKAWQWFPFAVLIAKTNTVHYAVFFYEFLFMLLAFLYVWFFLRKKELRSGVTFFTVIGLFSIGHGLMDMLRQDRILLFGTVSTATFVCGVLLLLSVSALLLLARIPEKTKEGSSEPAGPEDTAASAAPESQTHLEPADDHAETPESAPAEAPAATGTVPPEDGAADRANEAAETADCPEQPNAEK